MFTREEAEDIPKAIEREAQEFVVGDVVRFVGFFYRRFGNSITLDFPPPKENKELENVEGVIVRINDIAADHPVFKHWYKVRFFNDGRVREYHGCEIVKTESPKLSQEELL